MSKYIDAEKLKTEIKRELSAHDAIDHLEAFEVGKAWNRGHRRALENLLSFIDSHQQEQPDKETILRICKLHKAWSIIAPWENVEDFVITNWKSENIV